VPISRQPKKGTDGLAIKKAGRFRERKKESLQFIPSSSRDKKKERKTARSSSYYKPTQSQGKGEKRGKDLLFDREGGRVVPPACLLSRSQHRKKKKKKKRKKKKECRYHFPGPEQEERGDGQPAAAIFSCPRCGMRGTFPSLERGGGKGKKSLLTSPSSPQRKG